MINVMFFYMDSNNIITSKEFEKQGEISAPTSLT